MTGNEIRQKFLDYFQQRGHKLVHSSPVFPPNDPTILFTNAGMNQFKDVFLGNEKRDYKRATSSQKCLRAGGKHNDLDEVGKTARHHTFFEMLGNFSFGDYFKEQAINFAWDFLTGSLDEGKLGLDPKYLWFTYFEGDENVPADIEARDLWIKIGANPERILPFGRKDNFWQMGDTGPCGPSSEIFYYMEDEPDNPDKNHPKWVNGEGDTTVEIWNLVFMQYNRNKTEEGEFKLENLPAPSVDTGAGLERLTAVLNGKRSTFDTDFIKPIIDFTASLSVSDEIVYPNGKEVVSENGNLVEKSVYQNFDEQKQFACRVIADHARATAFAIADGILPGNQDRNYVLRKIMRRAIYHGREHLGFHDLFFYKVCDFVVEQMKDAYPELETQREFIGKMVRLEEERFGNTLTIGLKKLSEILSELESKYKFNIWGGTDSSEESIEGFKEFLSNPEQIADSFKMLDLSPFQSEESKKAIESFGGQEGFADFAKNLFQDKEIINQAVSFMESPPPALIDDLVKLYDTFGVPKDLIRLKLEEKTKITLPEDFFETRFNEALKKLQEQSAIGKTQQNEKINPIYKSLEETSVRSNFHGYEKTQVEDAKVVALVKDDQQIEELKEGEEGLIILDETPFYAEAGGQVGDRGNIFNNAAQIAVHDTFAPIVGIVLHKAKVKSGSIKVGDVVTATVDVAKRDATRRNHTATHLVHAALKEVLGTHVKQGGSVVAPNFLRFDFTHYQSLTAEEVKEVEDLVNRYILQNEPVETDVMAIEEAMSSGAVALFGEKYGSDVRVLRVGEGIFSKELCGGTHVRATGDIGSFKITADESIASGVRRIRAVTGIDAFERFRDDEILIEKSLSFLKTQRDQLPNAIEKLQDELKKTRRENDELKMKIATGAIGNGSSTFSDDTKEINGVNVVAKIVEGLDKGGMRHLSDTLLAKMKSGVVVLGRTEEDKVSFIVRVSDDLTDKVKAGKIVQEIAPIVGGKGGGRPDMAEGGGTDASKLDDALQASYKSVEKMLGEVSKFQ